MMIVTYKSTFSEYRLTRTGSDMEELDDAGLRV